MRRDVHAPRAPTPIGMAWKTQLARRVALAVFLNILCVVGVGSAEEQPPPEIKAIIDRMTRISATETIAVVGLGSIEPKTIPVPPPSPNHCDNLKDQGKACSYTFGGGFVRLGYTPDKRGIVFHRFVGSCSLMPASLTFTAIFLDSVLEIGDLDQSRSLVRDAISSSQSRFPGPVRYTKEIRPGWSMFVSGPKSCSFVLEKKAG